LSYIRRLAAEFADAHPKIAAGFASARMRSKIRMSTA
jgi:type VI protein secretion system component VasA